MAFMSAFDDVYAQNPLYPVPRQSRFTIASIFAVSGKERFRKYHAPAKVSLDEPKAAKSTEEGVEDYDLIISAKAPLNDRNAEDVNVLAQDVNVAIAFGELRFFGDAEAIAKHFSTYLTELRESPKANGAERIYTHGEKEMEAIKKVQKEGIPVNVNTVKEMVEMAEYLGMDVKAYFGDFDYKNTNFKSSY